ncbi:LuxR C-terminal-related transcriptional regulator [Qipengyuania oceanensis]|uniref:PAS domain-containing protein n=1 Tax=Qipengyuania oceanensis TaxID=1463597 RepID=A0A844YKV2_9SPHN|nr:LuxR C-terminal-related transcriptional regulator [Qipengyuania oceanensis]MXO64135.1 PAS domain-containing protein [Qipengyuania oceanensis]
MSHEEELLASIHLSPLATIITDFRQPDNPIIGANEAFCHLTGYAFNEVIGRNCRFLSGPDTEAEGKHLLSKAIADGRPALAEITNYRKDGSSFCNAVMMAPIKNAAGMVTHFIGTQMLVRDGTDTEHLRRRRAKRLVGGLTPRQLQVLQLLTNGLRNHDIGVRLNLSEATVKLHRSNLLKKLGANSPGEAVRIALEAGVKSTE